MRNTGLDILRGIAVVLVLFRHVRLPARPSLPLIIMERGGWIGVDLFFVLSGFLVSGLLFREWSSTGHLRVGRFLARRAWKIYPQFYLLLAATMLPVFQGHLEMSAEGWLGEILFVQNYVGKLWPHTWSLAVEEHFYLFLAFAVWTMVRMPMGAVGPFRSIPWLFCAVAILCQLLRVDVWHREEIFTHETFTFPTHLRIDSLLFGVLISYLWTCCRLEALLKAVSPMMTIGPGMILLLPAFVWQSEHYPWVVVFGTVSNYLGAGLILVGVVRFGTITNRFGRFAAFLGRASYSTYLWHIAVGILAWEWTAGLPDAVRFGGYLLFYFGGSLGVGAVAHLCFEGPILRLRERFLRA